MQSSISHETSDTSGVHNKSSIAPIIAAYKTSAEEFVWLKPATWIAGISLVMGIGSGIFFWGQSFSQKVDHKQLEKAVEKLPTKKEMHSELRDKASKESVLKLQGTVNLMKKDIQHIKDRQSQGFKQINKRLDRLLDRGQIQLRPSEKKRR